MGDESVEPHRNGVARQADLDRVRDDVRELRDGLIGNERFPGGRLGQITAQSAQTQDEVRTLADTVHRLPERMIPVIDARIEAAQKASKGDRAVALLSKWETFVVGVAVLVIGSVLTTILVAHFTSHP